MNFLRGVYLDHTEVFIRSEDLSEWLWSVCLFCIDRLQFFTLRFIAYVNIRFICMYVLIRASQVALVVKNLPADGGDRRDTGSIPGLGRSPEGGHGNPVQYSCLENPMDRGAWRATVHRVTKSHTWPKQLSMHVCKSWICNLDKPLWCKNHC